MNIKTIQTGTTLVSSAVPDRNTHKWKKAYTRLFQSKRSRIEVPVKCYYISVGNHNVLIDTGWSEQVAEHPVRHLGYGLFFASEPVMQKEQAAIHQLAGKDMDCILMTHLDCDHASGLQDFKNQKVLCAKEEYEYARKNKIRYGKLIDDIAFEFICFQEDSNAVFGKSADIFGDGSVIAYITPTHSAGSVIYKITEDNKFYLIVGDNGYMNESWEKEILPGPLFNENNMLKCLKWIKQNSKAAHCLGVLCAHGTGLSTKQEL